MTYNPPYDRNSKPFFDLSSWSLDKNSVTEGSGAWEKRKGIGRLPVQTQAQPLEKSAVLPLFLRQTAGQTLGVKLKKDIENVEYLTISKILVTGITVPARSIICVVFDFVNGQKVQPNVCHTQKFLPPATIFIESNDDGTLAVEKFHCPVILQLQRSAFAINSMNVKITDVDGTSLPYESVNLWGFAHTLNWQ